MLWIVPFMLVSCSNLLSVCILFVQSNVACTNRSVVLPICSKISTYFRVRLFNFSYLFSTSSSRKGNDYQYISNLLQYEMYLICNGGSSSNRSMETHFSLWPRAESSPSVSGSCGRSSADPYGVPEFGWRDIRRYKQFRSVDTNISAGDDSALGQIVK